MPAVGSSYDGPAMVLSQLKQTQHTQAVAQLDVMQLVPPLEQPDYEQGVLKPLREAQAKRAEEERLAAERAAQEAARIEAERARQRQLEVAEVRTSQVSGGANLYDWGNCTWYVASQRPVPSSWGNANQWLWHAQAAGWATGRTPQVGAIAWTGAGYAGHVGLVVGLGDGTVTVREMNVMGLGVVSTGTYPASQFMYIY